MGEFINKLWDNQLSGSENKVNYRYTINIDDKKQIKIRVEINEAEKKRIIKSWFVGKRDSTKSVKKKFWDRHKQSLCCCQSIPASVSLRLSVPLVGTLRWSSCVILKHRRCTDASSPASLSKRPWILDSEALPVDIITAPVSQSWHSLGPRSSENTVPSCSLTFSLDPSLGLIKAGSPQINPNEQSRDLDAEWAQSECS